MIMHKLSIDQAFKQNSENNVNLYEPWSSLNASVSQVLPDEQEKRWKYRQQEFWLFVGDARQEYKNRERIVDQVRNDSLPL